MTPTIFPHQNGTVSDGAATSCFTDDISDLPVHRDGMQIISCWRLLFIERLRLLFTGRVWLLVLATRAHPPVHLTAESPFAKPRRVNPLTTWLPVLLIVAVALLATAAAFWIEHDNHAVWIQHCVDLGSNADACEKRWQDGKVQP